MTHRSERGIVRSLLAAAAASAGVAACAFPPGGSRNGPAHVQLAVLMPESAAISATVATSAKTYRLGAPVVLTLTVKNGSGAPQRLSFSSGQKYDFEIHSGSSLRSHKVWQWSNGRMFAMMMNSTTIEPGKSITYKETFDPRAKGPDGKTVSLPAGPYTVGAVLKARPSTPAATTTFTVR
jgi:hypothetical protein